MLFGETTLKELINSYLDLLHTSRKFLKTNYQIEVILHLCDETHKHQFDVRNDQLKQVERLRITEGMATVEVRYQGTQLKSYQAFEITNQRYRPKYFMGWIGNEKVDKDYFIRHIEPELRQMVKPYVHCVIFPGLFV